MTLRLVVLYFQYVMTINSLLIVVGVFNVLEIEFNSTLQAAGSESWMLSF